MKWIPTVLLMAVCGLSLGGCAHQQPLITHAHIGHCLTSWHDTPEQQGLFEVARKELDMALHETDAALAPEIGPTQKAQHLANVVHALNPDMQPLGPGLDYGAVRALEGAVEHLEYAATSEDASLNVASSVAGLSELGFAILERLRTAATKADAVQARDVASLDRAAIELRAALRFASVGFDVNGNGRVDPIAAEAGLQQMNAELNAMLARETNPAYEPLPRKYLLGLVKLPSGKWVYQSLRKAMSRPTYGY